MTGPWTGHLLRWPHGQARVLARAAMLADCRFDLPSGPFHPFARAPWTGAFHDTAVSGHLWELGGDFVCLPFGLGRVVEGALPDWAPLLAKAGAGMVHGPAADQVWRVDAASDSAITLSLDYPAPSPVLRMERRISVCPDAPALECTWTIHARRPARVAAGLHPILRLPDIPGRLELQADFAFGLTHPAQVPPGTAQEFATLAAVPRPGGPLDLSHLPLHPKMDLNAQLCGLRGPVRALWLDEGAGLLLDWDRALLPSVQLWHTDGGIGGDPWNHGFRGLGVEPVAAAFDLGQDVSEAPNPISARGVATTLAIDPSAPVVIAHRLEAFAI
jgi:hypothetical protein